MKNIPYVKKYSAITGELINPIIGSYDNKYPNRSQRRSELKQIAKLKKK